MNFPITQHIRYFAATNDGHIAPSIGFSQLNERVLDLLLPASERNSFSARAISARVQAAAVTGLTLIARGPKSGGSALEIRTAGVGGSVLAGSTGVADKGNGTVSTQRAADLIANVDVNHDDKLTTAELTTRVNADSTTWLARTGSQAGWNLLLGMLAAQGQTMPDKSAYITAQQVRDLYAGTLFFEIAERNGYAIPVPKSRIASSARAAHLRVLTRRVQRLHGPPPLTRRKRA